jgi:pimeloyl-ACP methyl ester carboxylesterase
MIKKIPLAVISIILIGLSYWQIKSVTQGLLIESFRSSEPPLTRISLKQGDATSRPTILIGHGFAGSEILMREISYAIAYAGYTVIAWDFDGHGGNSQPISENTQSGGLLQNAERALQYAAEHHLVDPNRIAILGHSMGSGVALAFGQTYPNTAATIAISPVNQPVTVLLPKNLLLLAGSLEAPFAQNAKTLLASAGGAGGDPSEGTARQFMLIPGVEHISILFSPKTTRVVCDWLNSVFGIQPYAVDSQGRRIIWYGVGIIGYILLAAVLLPSVKTVTHARRENQPFWKRIILLISAGLLAVLVLWVTSLLGISLRNILGLSVGGYLYLWFCTAGMLSLSILKISVGRPSTQDLMVAMIAFATLWIGIGLMGHLVWLHWLLITPRLIIWLVGSFLISPWFLAFGSIAHQGSQRSQIGWWLIHSVTIAGCLFIAMQLSRELGFLLLILPVIPIMLGLQTLVVSPRRGVWSYAIPAAGFISWILASVFPLTS